MNVILIGVNVGSIGVNVGSIGQDVKYGFPRGIIFSIPNPGVIFAIDAISVIP